MIYIIKNTMLQLQEIIKEVYDRLAVDDDNTTYSKEGRVIPKINSVMHRILSDRKYDVVTENSQHAPCIKGWDLQFLRWTYSFERKPNKVSCETTQEWDNRVYILNTQKMAIKGYCLIKGEIYHYQVETDWTRNRLLLDRDAPTTIEWGSDIEFLYKIPEESEATYQLFAVVNNREVEMTYADYRYQNDFSQFRSILYKDGISLIRICVYDARFFQTFKLNYYKKVASLVEDIDTTVFPEERWDREVLALLVAGELLYETEKTDDASIKLNEWYGNLILFYDKYATTNKWYREDLWWNRNLQSKNVII